MGVSSILNNVSVKNSWLCSKTGGRVGCQNADEILIADIKAGKQSLTAENIQKLTQSTEGNGFLISYAKERGVDIRGSVGGGKIESVLPELTMLSSDYPGFLSQLLAHIDNNLGVYPLYAGSGPMRATIATENGTLIDLYEIMYYFTCGSRVPMREGEVILGDDLLAVNLFLNKKQTAFDIAGSYSFHGYEPFPPRVTGSCPLQ
ncbi:MAG: hypothetical protein WC636_04445 [Candidatus Margulisiibacteriota bacterium]